METVLLLAFHLEHPLSFLKVHCIYLWYAEYLPFGKDFQIKILFPQKVPSLIELQSS